MLNHADIPIVRYQEKELNFHGLEACIVVASYISIQEISASKQTLHYVCAVFGYGIYKTSDDNYIIKIISWDKSPASVPNLSLVSLSIPL